MPIAVLKVFLKNSEKKEMPQNDFLEPPIFKKNHSLKLPKWVKFGPQTILKQPQTNFEKCQKITVFNPEMQKYVSQLREKCRLSCPNTISKF